MEKVIKVLQEQKALKEVSLTSYKVFLFDKRSDTEAKVELNEAFETKCSNSLSSESVKSIRQNLNKLGLELEFSQQIAEGEKIPQYKELHNVFSEQQNQMSHQPGEVLLIDVWATWCGPCQKPMQHNQEMLEKNQEKWKGKVRIVAVSVDEDKEVIKQRVNTKGWNKIEHLTLLGWKGDHPLIQNFNIQGIPFVCLINKQGKIDYTGHPSQTNLQQRINELLQKIVTQTEVKQEIKHDNSPEELLTAIKQLQPLQQIISKETLQNKFKNVDLFSILCNGQTKIVKGKLEKCEVTIKVSTYQDTPEVIQQFKDLLKNVDPKIYKIEENLVKFVHPPAIENAECVDCKAKLSYPCYWCKWDPNPNSLRCRDCVEKKPAQQDKHYSYLNNSVLLTGTYKRIAVKGLGSNIQPKEIEQVNFPNQFCCNGCGDCPETIGEARYICLGCRSDPNHRGDYVDICQKCYTKYFNGDENIKSKLNDEGHKQNHPMLRILYNVEGYYNF